MPKISFNNIFGNCTSLKNVNFSTVSSVTSSYNHEEYLKSIEENAWHNLFDIHCEKNPEKSDTYNTLLKLSNNNYKKVVLDIEMELNNE